MIISTCRQFDLKKFVTGSNIILSFMYDVCCRYIITIAVDRLFVDVKEDTRRAKKRKKRKNVREAAVCLRSPTLFFEPTPTASLNSQPTIHRKRQIMIMNRSTVLLLGMMAASKLDSLESLVLRTSICSRRNTIPQEVWSEEISARSSSSNLSLFRRTKKTIAPEDLVQPPQNSEDDDEHANQLKTSRRSFLSATAAGASLIPFRTSASPDKQINISDSELKKIVLSDIVEKSFLVTADITRSIYDESATFTDEIDVYTMDKWVKGTKSLFIPSGSRVSLVGDVDVSKTEVSFRFDEDLMFNIPFKPVCSLTGKVILTRDESTGLITRYREFWDQSVSDVLKTAKFGKKA